MQHSSAAPRVAAIVCGLAIAATVAAVLAPAKPLPEGLLGRYYATADFSGDPILERVDRVLSTEALAATHELAGRTTFSVEWTGSLLVQRDGIHRFATKSDDGSWLWIDEQLVIDNGGAHSIQNVGGQVFLREGAHGIRVRFSQHGGGYFLQVGQVGPSLLMAHPAPLVPFALSTPEWRLRENWPLALVALWYASLGSVALMALKAARGLPVVREMSDACADGRVRWIVAIGMALAAAHIAYGVPAIPSFSSDELEPLDTLAASRDGFRYWNLRWPPLHAFVIAGVLQPFAWAEALVGLSLRDSLVVSWMFIVVRGLSVLLVGLSLLLTFDATRVLADRRAGYFAAALLACTPLVVFFGSLSNLEIPHLFWVTATLWLFVKLCAERQAHWFVLFGAAVGFSLAVKDQAYGYYLLAPVALVVLIAREKSGRGASWVRALIDRRLFYVAGATLLALAIGHALPWRVDRFVERLSVMVGPASAPYQMFTATPQGQVALLAATVKSLVWAAGAPLMIAFIIGGATLIRRGRALLVLALLLPVITYYAGFLSVILYVYDRFLIGWLPIVAAIGGIGLAALSQIKFDGRALGAIGAAAIVAVGIVNAVATNLVFARDPRHAAWAWLRQHVPCGSSVGVTFNGRYVPPLDCLDMWEIRPGAIDGMVRWPQYLLLNDAYIRRFARTPSGAAFMQALESGDAGYRRVWRHDATPPRWAPMYWEERFWNGSEDAETTADKPLHAIEVWECVDRPGCVRPAAD